MEGGMPSDPVQFHLAHSHFLLENHPQMLSPSIYEQRKATKIRK